MTVDNRTDISPDDALAALATPSPEDVLRPLGDCLITLMADSTLDLEVFPLKPDGSRQLEGEGGIEMAVRLLKLAASRGAFTKAPESTSDLPGLAVYLRQVARSLLAEDPAEGASILDWADVIDDVHALITYLIDAHRPGAVDDASVCAVGENGRTAPSRVLELLKLAMSRGAFAPGKHPETVASRFRETFYAEEARTVLRFEGLPDIYVPDADAHALAKTVLSGGERSEPSWKVISRAAEYFGQRVHVDSARGKLVLTDSSTYHPGEADKASEAREAAADARIMSGNLIAARGHGPQVMQAALASAATLLDRLAGILEPVREDRTREMCADDFGPEAGSPPAAEAENL